MKILRIDHLGIAVPALGPAVSAYEALGFTVDSTHDVPTEQVRTAFLPVGESHLELLEPTSPTSVIARFLEKRAGLHHVCLIVDDIVAALAELEARGVPLVDPKAAAGVLLELKEEPRVPEQS
jgi:methylmalonyl-CoA epimerase